MAAHRPNPISEQTSPARLAQGTATPPKGTEVSRGDCPGRRPKVSGGPFRSAGRRSASWGPWGARAAVLLVCVQVSVVCAQASRRVYADLLNPKEHPDYDRRHVKPPSWETFGNRTQFTSLRGFGVEGDRIVNAAQELDKYTRTHDLGDVIWPTYTMLFAKNVGELADEIKRRNLYLFDIWGFVPGSGPPGYWQQFKPAPGVLKLLESKLGERWLGMDVGEQDGRYVGGYAPGMYPTSANRFEQYLNFQRHFQRMCDDLGNRMSALVSLNFGHYYLKEGVYTLLGAETAQGLPNGQVYYAFIRGAGKQYGVPWFGNASVFNRWGWKVYGPEGKDGGYTSGPTWGTSLNLLKRLMYSHILYNCVCVGFESSWFEGGGDKLSPIGRIQQAAHRWVRQNGQPGVMLTPIAVMTDFFAGWSFPRHLYSGEVCRVWGNLPYRAGDHLTDGVLDMLYPGYQDSSYYHDESGFIAPTPFGDSADCLLSDAPGWLLARYPLLVVAGELSGGAEMRDTLEAYAEGGGTLVLTAGSLAKLGGGLAGVRVAGGTVRIKPGQVVQIGGTGLSEERAFDLQVLAVPPTAKVTGTCGDVPVAAEVPCGKGRVIVLASPFGVAAEPATSGRIASDIDKPLPKPYPLLKHVRAALERAMQSQTLFDAGTGLSLITCRKAAGEYTLGLCNNSLRPLPMKIASRCGPIESVREIPLDQSEKGAVGFLPRVFEQAPVGRSDETTIAGGDVRLFAVKVREQAVEVIPHVAPPPRPKGRVLPLRNVRSIKEEVLARPTFFEHYDGVLVDWRYLHEREKEAIRHEAGWIDRQGLRVVVDLTSGINLYPDLRLIDNLKEDYQASMAAIEDVIAKMPLLGSRDLVLALHKVPENNFSAEQTWASFDATLRQICKQAADRQITVHLRIYANRPPGNVSEALAFLKRVGAANLRLAPNTAMLLGSGAKPKDIANQLKDVLGLWMVGAQAHDLAGHVWNVNAPIAGSPQASQLAELLALLPGVPVVFDATFRNQDEEYLDARELNGPVEQDRSSAASFPGKKTAWNGFDHYEFTFDGRTCYVVVPQAAAPGRPWIWRARFFGHRPEVDIALLSKGFHLAFMDTIGMFGSPKAIAHRDRFYDYLVTEHGFARKVALEGMSRGGLDIFNWAAANPDKVACIYADAPVCDFKSWPGGKGRSKGAPDCWQQVLKAYGFTEEQAMGYKANPIDNLAPLARAHVPLLHVTGDADEVVPIEENTRIIEQRYKQLGGEITVIIKPGIGHKHGLDNPGPIVDFILKNTLPRPRG
jgi:pimeloyl-ACP methyl ester carboxylesterase